MKGEELPKWRSASAWPCAEAVPGTLSEVWLQLSLNSDTQHTQRQAAGENDGKAQGGPAKAQAAESPHDSNS